MLMGCGEEGLGFKERGVWVNSVFRWANNRPPNGTKFDRRSTGDIPRPLGKSWPISRTFSVAHKTRTEGGDGRMRVWVGLEQTTERTGETQTDATF